MVGSGGGGGSRFPTARSGPARGGVGWGEEGLEVPPRSTERRSRGRGGRRGGPGDGVLTPPLRRRDCPAHPAPPAASAPAPGAFVCATSGWVSHGLERRQPRKGTAGRCDSS